MLNRLHKSPLADWVANGLLAALVAIALLSLVSTQFGWTVVLELAAHFQRQYLWSGLLLLSLLLLTRRKLPIAIGLACVLLLFSPIAPWYFPAIQTPTAGTPLKVLVSNLNVGNQQPAALLALIRREQPDLVGLVEVTDAWVKPLASLSDILPHQFGLVGDRTDGILVLSRVPLADPQMVYFGSDDRHPSISTQVSVNQQRLSLIVTHPFPPLPRLFEARNQHLQEASEFVRQIATPTVLIGDLNITMWSPYYRQFIDRTGLKNARQGFGILPSWFTASVHSPLPGVFAPLLSIPIDHCLVSPNIQVANFRTGTNVGSDHLPVIADLVLPPA